MFTDQLVGNLVHHVGIVESSSLVLPPAFDVDTWLLFKVGKMEVIPVKHEQNDLVHGLEPEIVSYQTKCLVHNLNV